MGDVGFQRRRVRSGQRSTPELLRSRVFERLPLQTDVLGEHGRRVDLGVDRRHLDADAEQVVLHQLAHQVGSTPAVQNRVMKREDQIDALISDERAQAVQRGAAEVVPLRVSGGHVVLDIRITGSGHDVERSWHPRPDNLHWRGMLVQFKRGPQRGMPCDQPIERIGELLFSPRHRHAIAEDVLVHRRIRTFDAVEEHSELQCVHGERILGVVQRCAVDQRKQCERVRDACWCPGRPRTRLGQFGDRRAGVQFLDVERDTTLLRLGAHDEGKD